MQFLLSKAFSLLLLVLTLLNFHAKAEVTAKSNVELLPHTVIHVTANGTVSGSGSKDKPLNSLLSARNKIRQMKSQGVKGTFEVIIGEGDYTLLKGLTLSSKDSGTVNSPIIYRALPGVKARFFGGTMLDSKAFYPLASHTDFAKRLVDKSAAKHIKVINLNEQGVDELGKLVSHGWGLEPESRVPPVMLTIGGKRMSLARWPNVDAPNTHLKVTKRMQGLNLGLDDFIGFTSYSRVIDKGIGKKTLSKKARNKGWENSAEFMQGGGTVEVEFDRMRYWHASSDIFIDGVVSSSWEWTYNRVSHIDVDKKQFTLEMGAALTGVGDKLKASHFFFENVAEELDQPGEYYIDRDTSLLYLYPPDDFEQQAIVLSSLEQPAILAKGANYIRFENLTFDTGRNLFAQLSGTSGFELINNTITNFVKGGIDVTGNNNLISGNEISAIGGYGVKVDGGSLKHLSKANNVVEYNHIHNFAWDQRSQIPAIYLNGVGSTVAHNKIHDGPHFAIRIKGGNDHLVEYNEIFDVVKYHKFDGGALYIYNTKVPEQRGSIIRKNYFHDIPNKRHGVYIDNHTMGMFIEDNLFVGVESPVNINSGHDNQVNRNIMVDCPTPIRISKFSFNKVYNEAMKQSWQKRAGKFIDNVQRMPHKKYPSFVTWLKMTDAEKRKGISYGRDNVFFNPKRGLAKQAQNGIEDQMKTFVSNNNLVLVTDPGFINVMAGDYSIAAKDNPAGFAFDIGQVGLAGRKSGVR